MTMPRKPRKPRKTFAEIAAARTHYNPEIEGYGNPRQWRGAFYQRMGWEEAQRVIREGRRTPRQILGVSDAASWQDIQTAYRKLAMDCHPDRSEITGMTKDEATRAFQELTAAYTVLAHQHGQ